MKVTNSGLQNDAETQDVSFETIFNGTAKAWGNLNGTGTIAERDSFNISSYTDNATGDYTYTFTNSMGDTNYNSLATQDNGASTIHAPKEGTTPAVGSQQVQGISNAGAAFDLTYAQLQIMGGLA